METKEDLELAFANIAQHLLALPKSQKGQLTQMSKLNFILAVDKKRSASNWVKFGAIFAVILIAEIVFHMDMYSFKSLAKAYLIWQNRDIYSEQCVWDMPNAAQDIFRPPVSCSMCENVHLIDKVYSIEMEEFREKYAYSRHPVVITDATVNWTAMSIFTFEYFKQLYGDESPALENYRQSCQFFPYQTEFRNLRQVFNMSLDRAQLKDGSKPWYVGWSNCDSIVANELRKSYARPYFLPHDSESSKTDWIFMGSPGYGAHMHIDHVGNPSWQAQISGSKRWILLPPPECIHQCQPLEIIVQPGEIIVLDTNAWFHRTQIVGDDISITIGSEYD